MRAVQHGFLGSMLFLGSAYAVSEPVVSIAGNEAEAWFGTTMAWVDGNSAGDGRFIVGASVSDTVSSERPGQAFVYELAELGSGKGATLIFELSGEANGDKFGASVASAGDLTGDGYADWLVGAPGNNAGGIDSGRAYIFSGKTGELVHVLTGEAANDWFGFSVAAIGDVNEDGVVDVAVGARRPSGEGYVRVFCGATFDLIHELRDTASSTHFGMAVAGFPGHGDVNGDGVDDIIVGAPFHSGPATLAGRAMVFSGADGTLLHTFDGEESLNFFGTSVAIAGDVNGDGHADVLVGADANNSGGTDAGRAYLFAGDGGSLLHVFTGTEQHGRFGRGVSAVGDVTGNGHADVLIGQPAPVHIGGTGLGRAFVFSGDSGKVLHEFVGSEIGDMFGFSVAGNRRAHCHEPNVLVGAFASNVNGVQSGRVDVFELREQVFGDLNGDGIVDTSDLLILLGQWGPCPANECPADLNGDGVVDVSDLLLLLSNWS